MNAQELFEDIINAPIDNVGVAMFDSQYQGVSAIESGNWGPSFSRADYVLKYITGDSGTAVGNQNVNGTRYYSGCISYTAEQMASLTGAKYNIYRGTTKIGSDISKTEFVDDDFPANAEQTWSVKTVCHNGEAPAVSVKGKCVEVSISELTNGVSIFPNPANSTVTINATGFAKVEVYNTVGQLIETQTVRTVDVSSYNTGIYFFKVYDVNNNSVTKRVMVAR